MNDPALVLKRLNEIDTDLATRIPVLESAAMKWFRGKRDREKAHAQAFMTAQGTVAERQAQATIATSHIAVQDEAEYEAIRAVVRVLETRANVGMAILKSQGRGA